MRATTICGAFALASLVLVACGQSQEEQFLREGWGCSDQEALDECEQRYGDEVQASLDETVAERDALLSGSSEDDEPSESPAPTESGPAEPERPTQGEGDTVDDLYVDIHSLDSCTDADYSWGGLMNAEMEGYEIDRAYLADLEEWMKDSFCW